LIGPAGYGPSAFVAPGTVLPYEIDFENSPSATAPAQEVTVSDPLDPNLDPSTFQLTQIAFGSVVLIVPPADDQDYETTVSMTYNGQTLNVEIRAGIDLTTDTVFATFQSVDPNTGLPPDALTGFLPPEDGTGRGQGRIDYTIQANPGLPTGTTILNVASINFDNNGIITTDQVDDEDPSQGTDPTKEALITIDSGAPTSSVSALPAYENSTSFTLNWTGSDDAGGSGIATFDIYVSDNGDAYSLWMQEPGATFSDTFTGQNGHTYSFYSVATDNVGNVEATPSEAQATTEIVALNQPTVTSTTTAENTQTTSAW
jgi:hypothetical protein